MTPAPSVSLTCSRLMTIKRLRKFRLVDAIAYAVGGEVAAKLIAKVKQSGSFGYTAVLPENGAAQNPTTRELARPLDTIRQ
jgi:hypothetical protein